MVAGTRTFRIEETLLDPPAIDPPPTRHALLVFLIALAALLHVATIGSGDLYSQTEGQYAGAAREMIETHQWLLATNDGIPRLQKPPLLYWLIIFSFKLFGVNAAAARLPIALAVVSLVALVFLIGEKLADYWRGFVAGLICLSLCGTFLLARIVMPEPLVSAFIAGAIFCGVCGYQRRQHRRAWFAGFWISAALACLTKGMLGLIYPVAVFVLLSIFYREARMRFRALLRWDYLLIFCLIVAPWHIWAQWHFPGYFHYLINSEWVGHLRGVSDATHDLAGCSRPAISWLAFGLVVSMVGRALAGRDFCLAASVAAARDRIRRCIAPLLDGRRLCASAFPWPTPGLLLDEHVERARTFAATAWHRMPGNCER